MSTKSKEDAVTSMIGYLIALHPEHLRANAETLLVALRRTNRRKCRSGIIAACILFAAFAWLGCLWLTRHFLP